MAKDIELAIVFADVVGSTRLYEELGDQRAREVVSTCIDIMKQATDEHHGTVIKTMGDEVMSTFAVANDALNAAAKMQKSITGNPELTAEGHHVAIRIGCHIGPVVVENRDVFGSTVHTANRMTSQAKAVRSSPPKPWWRTFRRTGSRPCGRSMWRRSRARARR
jgi:class 3 adenylate cyclase